MNPSTAKATGLRERAHSTPEHDALQLWLFDKENQRRTLSDYIISDYNNSRAPYKRILYGLDDAPEILYGLDEDSIKITKLTEFPIYRPNKSIIGIVDCILTVVYSFMCREEDKTLIKKNNQRIRIESGNWKDNCNESSMYKKTVLCEIKPKLDSISSLISQIKIYRDSLVDHGIDNKSIEKNSLYAVVITTDTNTKFDQFLLGEGIKVFRVNKDELI